MDLKHEEESLGSREVVIKYPSNNSNTELMDVDQVICAISLSIQMCFKILEYIDLRSLLQDEAFQACQERPNFPKISYYRITHLCSNEHRFNSYCCPISSVQMVEDAQKLDRPLSSKPFFRVWCGCDGLVVVLVSGIMVDKHPIHLLWNPSIRESIVLPTPEFGTVKSTRYGFGYDSTSGDYKILRICDEQPSEILAFKGGSWRKIDKHPCGVSNAVTRTNNMAFVHEAFHWFGSSTDNRSQVVFDWTGSSRICSLISFSISKEVYGEIPLSEQMLSFVGIFYLGVLVLDGMLSFYSVTFAPGLHLETLKLWVLKDYGVKESWSALCTIQDPSFYRVIPKYRFADGELLFSCVHEPGCGIVLRTSVGPFASWMQASIHDIIVFTESLISPKNNRGKGKICVCSTYLGPLVRFH